MDSTLIATRPALPFIVLRRGGWLIAGATLLVVTVLWLRGIPGVWLISVLLALALAATLVWNTLVRRGEQYTLTPHMLTWESGVLHRLRVDVPLDRVQNTGLYRSLSERFFGLGTIGVATAGTDGYEAVWSSVSHPDALLARIQAAVQGAATHRKQRANDPAVNSKASHSTTLPVIGLAGGIGSGKSFIAAKLASLGCLVIDSDQRARAALDRPEIRDQLVGWWGHEILGPDDRVQRSKISEIVFRSPAERERLESLIHPLVRQDRAAMIAEAERDPVHRPRAVIIDAPLLFEVGLDRECDAIIFIDVPEDQRLRRVQASRGWSRSELDRRGHAQWPIERKKAASTHVLANADGDDPGPALATILDEIAPVITP